jgi:hypothetical protein
LAGKQRDVMNPSQMNVDVIFNKRTSPDYWLDRGILWPLKKGISSTPLGQRWGESRFGRRVQPQPHHQPGKDFYKTIRDANPKAARRVTFSITPLSLPFGLFTSEARGATKTNGQPNGEPGILSAKGAHDAVLINITKPDGSEAHVAIPAWLSNLLVQGQTGKGVAWPKGATEALAPLFDHLQMNSGMHPERVQAVIDFRQAVLPKFTEGGYLSPKQVDQILDFLSTQG